MQAASFFINKLFQQEAYSITVLHTALFGKFFNFGVNKDRLTAEYANNACLCNVMLVTADAETIGVKCNVLSIDKLFKQHLTKAKCCCPSPHPKTFAAVDYIPTRAKTSREPTKANRNITYVDPLYRTNL